MFDSDPVRNLQSMRDMVTSLLNQGVAEYEANTIAILGGLPNTNGIALQQAISVGQTTLLAQCALTAHTGSPLGKLIDGVQWTIEEVYARLAALGLQGSPEPICFHCPEGTCPARAQVMVEELLRFGVSPQKVWAFMSGVDPMLGPHLTPRHADGSPVLGISGNPVLWPFHVAPVVAVQCAQGLEWLVLDPSLAKAPIAVDEWHDLVGTPTQPQFRQMTQLGQPPVDPHSGLMYPGTGYWLSVDPVSGPGNHARDAILKMMLPQSNPIRPIRPLPGL